MSRIDHVEDGDGDDFSQIPVGTVGMNKNKHVFEIKIKTKKNRKKI